MLIVLIPMAMTVSFVILLRIGRAYKPESQSGKIAKTKMERFGYWCYRNGDSWRLMGLLSAILFGLILVFLVVTHLEYAPFPAKCEAVRTTLEISRKDASADLEGAAILHKIAEVNEKIAEAKYWNGSIWVGWFIPDKSGELELIK